MSVGQQSLARHNRSYISRYGEEIRVYNYGMSEPDAYGDTERLDPAAVPVTDALVMPDSANARRLEQGSDLSYAVEFRLADDTGIDLVGYGAVKYPTEFERPRTSSRTRVQRVSRITPGMLSVLAVGIDG